MLIFQGLFPIICYKVRYKTGDFAVAGKVKNLLNRDGRYFSRLVIPKELCLFLDNKTELREPLEARR
ncbi:hypothetical protein [Rhizobium sp. GN54]|uniref:hypothetical protein n=1 Tax=Rhizobium sp. GN54 TaxID=2898150 RepID=UPI001E29762B|nr:hypothetical protein [Rhizobium sp. GN54]MCD2185237.1 hypothetical protein [Rhizobium sp. GN54]